MLPSLRPDLAIDPCGTHGAGGPSALRQRLDDALERASKGAIERAPAALVLDPGPLAPRSLLRLAEEAASALRACDLVVVEEPEIQVFLRDTADPETPARRLLRVLLARAPACSAGLATSPDDGGDAVTLLAGAREAARCAPPGQLALVSDAVRTFVFGGRPFLILDPATKRLFDLVERLSSSDLPVLVGGETGAGKEIVALALHGWSPRRAGRIMAINCAALPDTLLESELFGYERGAFSGATAPKAGLLELGAGGTVFLDEIAECSPAAQAKLLRALETGRITRLGGFSERAADARVVSATNRSLEAEVAGGKFRQDLLYRLGAATLIVPPLRERRLDIPLLARHFLTEARARLGRSPLTISAGALRGLARHPWPGNVRELKNLMDYLAVTVDSAPIERAHLPERLRAEPAVAGPAEGEPGRPRPFQNLHDEGRALERQRMIEALHATSGVRMDAAALIGMPLRTFVTKLKRYAITIPAGHRPRRSA